MVISTIFFLIGLTFTNGLDRKLVSKLNPDCGDCTEETVLVYTRAIGTDDTIHQIWDFTGVPTVLFAIGSVDSIVNIGWWNKIPTKFTFTERPSYSFAFAIDKLYEYNDIDDQGKFNSSYQHKVTPLSNLSWRLTNKTLTDSEAMLKVDGKLRHHKSNKTEFIDIKLNLLPFTAESTELPHLIHTANSTLVDIRMVNLTMSREYNSSRFALHFILISSDNDSDTWNYTMTKTLDDEHTPGVFEIIEIKSPLERRTGNGGFLQFHPVAYTEPERGVSSSTNIYASGFNRTTLPNLGILKQFYQDYHSSLVVQDMFVSFGVTGDGFYSQHNFTAWSFNFGYGTPPTENFSLVVVIIIILISSVLCTVLLAGIGVVIYHIIKRCKQRRSHNFLYNNE